MMEDVIEQQKTFNTKGCPEDLIFGDFDNQPIPFTFSDFINYYDIYGTPFDSSLPDNEGVEDAVVPNDEDIGPQ